MKPLANDVDFISDNWKFVPLKSGGSAKAPIGAEWQNNPLSLDDVTALLGKTYKGSKVGGYGVICGPDSNGLLMVDLDGESAHALIAEWGELPHTWSVTSFRPGRKQLAYQVPKEFWAAIETSKTATGVIGNDDKPEQVELRWKGCQSVFYGRNPVSGREYQWSYPTAEPAIAPVWLIERMLVDRQVEKPVKPAPIGIMPLSVALAPITRDRLNGSLDKGRNDCGAAIARDLIGTAKHLDSIGKRYSGNPRAMFDKWCQDTGLDQDIPKGQPNQIWRKAERDTPVPALTPEMITNCIAAWERKQQPTTKTSNVVPIKQSAYKSSEGKAELDPDEALRLELLALAAESDPIKLARKRASICTTQHLSKNEVDELLLYVQTASSRRERRSVSLNEFLNRESEALHFLLPGLIPMGEMIILAAAPKVGKTNLATEIMHSVLTGGEVLGETARPGRVLFVTTDESGHTTQRRLAARGFDLLPHLSDNFRLLENFDIRELPILEQELSEFRPDLVVIDSLTGITVNSSIQEKDAEFGRIVYRLKDCIGRYGAASLLIHHENKDREAKGLNKIRGSSLLPAAAHSIWQLAYHTPDNESDPRRTLKIKSRESDAVGYSLQINPYDLWCSQGIFECFGEIDDEANTKKTLADRILNHLSKYEGRGLTIQEINNHLSLGSSIYPILTRLENRQQITKRRCSIDPKRWVYAVPVGGTGDITESLQTPTPSPHPSVYHPAVGKNSETTNGSGFDAIEQGLNTHLTPIEQGGTVKQGVKHTQTQAEQAIECGIEHFEQKKGGRGGQPATNPEIVADSLQAGVPVCTQTVDIDPYRLEW